MTNQEIINHAKNLIEAGKMAFEKIPEKDISFYHHDLEYDINYTDAIAFLLDEGYIKTSNKAIQDAFFDLIPEPVEFTNQKENFDALFSQDPQSRVLAAIVFDKLARAEEKAVNRFLFSHPKTFEKLIPALHDTEPKVVCNIIRALSCGSQRYFKNPVIPSILYPFFASKDKDILLTVILWTTHYQDDGKYNNIIELLKTKQSQGILRAITDHFKKHSPAKYKQLALPLLIHCPNQKISDSTQLIIVNAIIRILDEHTMPQFKSLLNLKEKHELAALFKKQINFYEGGENIAFLKWEIFVGK
jgi:hypothetical protein